MKLIYAVLFFLLALTTSVQCQQTTGNDLAIAWNENAMALLNLGKNGESLNASNEAIKLDPQLAAAWANKGAALLNLGKNEESLNASNEAIKLDPKLAAAWANKGEALLNLGKNEESLNASNEAIKLDPQLAPAWANKGAALSNLGKNEESLNASNEAIKLDPKLAAAWANKGAALLNLGKNEESLQASEKAIELDPQFAIAWFNKGLALNYQGEYDEAIQAYNKCIELNPQDVECWNYKGVALQLLGRTAEADAAFAKANELSVPENHGASPTKQPEIIEQPGPVDRTTSLKSSLPFLNLGKNEEAINASDEEQSGLIDRTTSLASTLPIDHSKESNEEDIFNLIEDGKIKLEAEGSGISSLRLKIEPTVELNIDVSIPAGTFFPANKGSTQNMISTKGITVKLEVEPGQDVEVDVPVACTNMHKAVPESSDVFEIERSSNNPGLMKLLPVLESEDANYPVKQAAIWIVTDNADYGDLGTLICKNRERVISGSEASEAMRLISKAGIDITNKAIWKDQDLIKENIGKPSCYKEEAVVTIIPPVPPITICEKCPAGYQGPDANCKCSKCGECPAGYQGPDANCECWKWVYE